MAGHSKWSQIKRAKAVKDAKKGASFAQRSREIMIAVKSGGIDPESNFRLRTAIDNAKTDGVPNDNIKRAIEKGSGSSSGDLLEDMTYEGYGPAGVAILVEAVTDNKNRTAGDLRSYFNKCQGNLGADGCVGWMFEQKGLIKLAQKGLHEATLFEIAIDAGATDLTVNEDEQLYELHTEPQDMNTVCQALTAKEIAVLSAEWIRLPQNIIQVESEGSAKFLLKLLDLIESHDDVQHVYSNFEMTDHLLGVLGEL
jgi:YebC/PmpR family DNA-binding regulatory protein